MSVIRGEPLVGSVTPNTVSKIPEPLSQRGSAWTGEDDQHLTAAFHCPNPIAVKNLRHRMKLAILGDVHYNHRLSQRRQVFETGSTRNTLT